jgi:HSP20 family protein
MSGRAARPRRGVRVVPPWDPLRDLMTLKDRLHHLLESVLRKGEFSSEGLAGWSPPVDLREQRDSFVLTCEVPGVRPDDLTIRIEGGIVTIEGRRPQEQEARSALRVERPYGSFSRTVYLPAPVDDRTVSARLRLGVLEVLLPRSSDPREHSIKVQVRS